MGAEKAMYNQPTNKATQKAREILLYPENYPGMPKWDSNSRIFILWKNDTLGDFITWALFSVEGTYYVRRIIWSRSQNIEAIEPHTYACDKFIPLDKAKLLIRDLNDNAKSLNLVDPDNNGITIDGVIRGAQSENPSVNWELQDHLPPPELNDWHEAAIKALNEDLPKHII